MARANIGKWGNSAAIRISKEELERMGLRIGDPIEYELHKPRAWDVSMIPVFRGGPKMTFKQVREAAWRARADDLARR